ncbi:hypothetical protein EJD97_016814, partial [Solanum chilense]
FATTTASALVTASFATTTASALVTAPFATTTASSVAISMEHSMAGAEEIGDEEKQLKSFSFDLKDYTIIKEERLRFSCMLQIKSLQQKAFFFAFHSTF